MPGFVTPPRKQSRPGAGPIVLHGPLPGKMQLHNKCGGRLARLLGGRGR